MSSMKRDKEEKRIMIVEDERIVAEDIKSSLKNQGFSICAMASMGMDAVEKAKKNRPDLVLMDINLKGEMDGIEAARQIRFLYGIPVIFLSAFSDEKTIERAKVTDPFGYIVKPFDERNLKVSIDMSLYKHNMENKLKESAKWFSTTLKSINDAVIATDKKGTITFMNPVAEELTGRKAKKAQGKPLNAVFNIIGEETGNQILDPKALTILGGSFFSQQIDTVMKREDGAEIPIEVSCSNIKDDLENVMGTVFVFRDITERKKAEKMLKQDALELEKANTVLRQALDELLERLEKKPKSKPTSKKRMNIHNRGAIYVYPLEKEIQARTLFTSMYDIGLPTLAVIRTPPPKFRKLIERDVETVWLTGNRVSEVVCLNPSNITRLSMVLTEFFNHAPNGVVFFEGLEYMISIVGFQDILSLIQILNDKIALNEGTIYLVLDLGVLDEKEKKYIQRECVLPLKGLENAK